MALIKCLGCGQLISDKALNCPKCGRANNPDESVGNNFENKIKEFDQIKKDNNGKDKSQDEITSQSKALNKDKKSINHKSNLPKILFGIIMFGSSVLAINYISNENEFADSPCNKECSWDCMMHVREMMGGRVQEIRAERWALKNDPKDWSIAWDACRNENGRAFQKHLLKNHEKYRNSKK